MSTATNEAYESYYVPDQSKLPIFASLGIFLTVYGMGNMMVDMTAGAESSIGGYILLVGGLVMGATLYSWFHQVIKENHANLYSAQMNRSYVWGMSWFIFSEVMFFAAFFGALFYIRTFAVPWIAGEGARGPSDMLWPGFEATWPLLNTPDPALFPGPNSIIDWKHLPLVNTVLLITSSVTLTFAHHRLNEGNRQKLVLWLAITVALGLAFLACQAYEYYEAYVHHGLTLKSGIYGTTFFMLTGFHGAHVTIGTIMLIVMLFRSIKGHFTKDDCFGFEAAAWYWHFVDVVWVLLFILVYIMGS